MFLFLSFLFVCLLIGLLEKKKSSTFESYSLSRGSFSSFVITCTIIASFTGGGSILGTIEKAHSTGFYAFCALLGFSLQLVIVGIFAPTHIKQFNGAVTIGDMFDKKYESWLKKVASLLWLVFSFGILAIQIKGMATILSGYSGWSLSTSATIGGLVLVTYCAFGGIRAVIYTDVIQLVAMYIVLPVILFSLIFQSIGLETFITNFKDALFVQPLSWDTKALASACLGFIAGDAFIPPVIQRILMAKNASQIRRTFILGSIGFTCLVFIAALIGITLSTTSMTGFENPIALVLNSLDDNLKAIVSLGLFAVVISSADTYLNATTSVIVKDLLNSKNLELCRVVTIIIGLSATLSAVNMANLFDMLLFFYKFWGPIITVPIFALLLGKSIKDYQLKICIILTITLITLWNFFDLEATTGISDLVCGLLLSASLFFIFRLHAKYQK